MKYTKILEVEQWEADELEKMCDSPPSPEHNVPKDSAIFDQEVDFDNGHRVAIQVITTTDPSEESCWTQGVLFEKNGNEISCTEVGESFLGEYSMWDGDTEYVVNVQVK